VVEPVHCQERRIRLAREYKPGRYRYSRSSQCYQADALAAQPLRVDAIALVER
jgi:hypothetical protein